MMMALAGPTPSPWKGTFCFLLSWQSTSILSPLLRWDQPQFRPVLGTQGLPSNTKNVPFLSVAGSYFGTLKRIKFPSLKDKDGCSGQDGG